MTGTVIAFVDERPVTVPAGATVRDAVQAFDPQAASKLEAARAYVTDGVGRRIAPTAAITPGLILRVVHAAPRDAEPDSDR